jgi:formylglycine-generating enzyme required for sulfatase activity
VSPGAGSPGLAPGAAPAAASPRAREVPPLHDCVLVPAGRYRLGEPERETELEAAVLIGRYPVANAHLRAFVEATGRETSPDLAARLSAPELADHPATGVTFADATAFCAWAGARLPTGAEWEAAARGTDGRPWPWGDVFDAERCACAEAAWGWTVPVTAHPTGASPCGAEQLAGNVWEWVDECTDDGWRVVRGGSYLDHAWGLRAARALPADPARATPTTGFRIAIDPRREP